MLFLLGTGLIGFIMYFRKTLSGIEKGTYQIINQEIQLREQVTKLIVADEKLVLFYEDAGYVAVYTQTGEFLYGIQVDTSDKGTGNISFLDGGLVIKSKANSVYYFDGSFLIDSFHISSDNLDQYRLLEKRMGDHSALTASTNGIDFSVSNGNIVKTTLLGTNAIVFPLPRRKMNPVFLCSFFLGVTLLLLLNKYNNS